MNFYKLLILSLCFTSFSYADLRSEFPSYSYVFTELNVDERFIDNPEFKRFVHQHKHEYRKRYIAAVKRGELIIPTLNAMIAQRNASPLFLYIAMVESDLKPDRPSPTGAGGLWQFTVRTGSQEFNLKVGKTLDERYDPIRATTSAISYLNQMNKGFKAWYLTTMAYNCGPTCVNNSIRKAGTKDLGTLISSRNNYIKPETRKYIKKVLLMAMIGENYLFSTRDNTGLMMKNMRQDTMTPVLVRSGESLVNLARVLNMKVSYLKKINAHLRNDKAPYKYGYKINIPTSRVAMFNKDYRLNQQYAQNRQYIQYKYR